MLLSRTQLLLRTITLQGPKRFLGSCYSSFVVHQDHVGKPKEREIEIEQLGTLLGLSSAMLGLSGAILDPSLAILGPSWGHLGAILGHLGAIFGHLNPILDPS